MATKVRVIDDAVYQVQSSNGRDWYTVRYCGSGDADPEYVALWECDCPAGQRGRHCKHMDLVGVLTNGLPEYDVASMIANEWVSGVELVDA